jgi:hypothetical protein
MSVPFTQSSHAALVPTGIVMVDGPTGEIRFNALAGTDSVMTVLAPLPVDPAQFRQVVDALIAEATPSRQAMLRSLYDGMSPPETRGMVRNLLVDRLGMIWLNVEASEPRGTEWLIIDVAGKPIGRVRTPPGLTIHEVGEDYVLGVWRDELDVESVRQYYLKR